MQFLTFLRKRGPLFAVLHVVLVNALKALGYTDAADTIAVPSATLPDGILVAITSAIAGAGAIYKSSLVLYRFVTGSKPAAKALVVALLALPFLSACSKLPPPNTGQPFLCTTSAVPRAELVTVKDPVPDRYIVSLNRARTRTFNVRQVEVFASGFSGLTNTRAIGTSSFATTIADKSAINKLLVDPNVAFVQQVQKLKLIEPLAAAAVGSWGQDRINQRALPLDGNDEHAATGKGVHAFVIDTGCPAASDLKTCRQDHPEFGVRYAAESLSVITFGGVDDQNGHATHVASTVGGSTFGIAKEVTLHSCRCLDKDGSGDTEGVARCVAWTKQAKLDHPEWPVVANMSLGGGIDPTLDQAIADANAAGVTFALAAGNSSEDACNASPARVDCAATTAASDKGDKAAFFTNVGKCVKVVGPGVDIVGATPTGGSASLSGTSMASPHTCGVAALILEKNPTFSPAQVIETMLARSTPDVIGGLPAGTPNKLLYSRPE
jgi:subtilisin family serine protease